MKSLSRLRFSRRLTGKSFAIVSLLAGSICSINASTVVAHPCQDESAIERVGEEIEFLSSDELEGRGVETKGIHVAADYIREEFKKAGLKSGVEDGSYYQPFPVRLGVKAALDKSTLVLKGPYNEQIELACGADFMPMQIGGTGEVSGELVFVGYGINAPDLDFQEYEGVDVSGKVVVVLRHEPEQNDESSRFNGKDPSGFAYVMTKITAAKLAGAAGILFVNDPISTPDAEVEDLLAADQLGTRNMGLPFAQIKQSDLAKLLEKAPLKDGDGNELADLAAIQKRIDETLKPVSQPLKGWSAELNCVFETASVEANNIIAVLEGEGPLSDETVIIGGHYDHLGYGGYGSRAPGRNEIHNGADDNATGTVAVLELARRFAARDRKPARRIVFIAFSAEERGLIGSRYYVENPVFPLDETVATINFDMIGWLRNNNLTIYGATTSPVFEDLVNKAADGTELSVTIPQSGFGGSDHLPFYQRDIPDMFIHTGLTDVYHTPEDKFESINVPGAVTVIDYSERLIDSIVELPARPSFRGKTPAPPRRSMAYLGAAPDFGSSDEGLYIRSVTEGSPAEIGGIETGDILLEIAGKKIANQQDLAAVLRENDPGEEVKVKIKRDGQEKELTVKLGESPRRRGR